jgi:hypothetical protein
MDFRESNSAGGDIPGFTFLSASYSSGSGCQMEVVRRGDHSVAAMRMPKEVASSFPWVDLVLFSELGIHKLRFIQI